MATDIVEDFDAGLEYAEAESVLRMVQRGDQRECLVRCGAARPPYSRHLWVLTAGIGILQCNSISSR